MYLRLVDVMAIVFVSEEHRLFEQQLFNLLQMQHQPWVVLAHNCMYFSASIPDNPLWIDLFKRRQKTDFKFGSTDQKLESKFFVLSFIILPNEWHEHIELSHQNRKAYIWQYTPDRKSIPVFVQLVVKDKLCNFCVVKPLYQRYLDVFASNIA